MKLNACEMAVCSSGHLSTNAGYNNPSKRAGGFLQPQSPCKQTVTGGWWARAAVGPQASTSEPLWDPLSRAGYLDAVDNQQLQPAPLSPLQIRRASARPLGFFSPSFTPSKHLSVALPISTLWALSHTHLKTKPPPIKWVKVALRWSKASKSIKHHTLFSVIQYLFPWKRKWQPGAFCRVVITPVAARGSHSMPVRARASPKDSSDLVPDGKLKKKKTLGSEWNFLLHNNTT